MTDAYFDYPTDTQGVSSALGAWGAAWQSGRCSPDDVLDVLGWWSARHRILAADAIAAQSLSLDPRGEESDALLRLVRGGSSAQGLAVLLVRSADLHALFPCDAQPFQGLQQLQVALFRVPCSVRVLDPEHKRALGVLGVGPVEQGCPDEADVWCSSR